MCYFCHAQLFEITYAENIKSPFVQHSCRNAKVVEVFCDAGCRLSTRCRPSIHRPPVDALRVPAEMPIALSWAPLHADIHVVRCCGRAHHREQRRHAIPIALAASHCPTARDFVPWRFLVAGQPNSIYASKPRTGLALRRHRKISPWIATCRVGFALQSRYVSRHATVSPPGRTALATPLVLAALR